MAKEWKVEGFEELGQALANMSKMYRADLVARNTMVKAVKEALVPAYESAYSLAKLGPPNKENIHMKETMRIDGRIPRDTDRESYFVREGDAVIGVLSVKKSAVSLANEFGTSKMAAQPFLRPGFESSINSMLDVLKTELSFLIERYAKTAAKKQRLNNG